MTTTDGWLGNVTERPALLALGADGVLARFSDSLDDVSNRAALALAARLGDAPPPGTVEIASSLVSVLVRFDPGQTDHAAVAGAIRDAATGTDWLAASLPEGRRRWHVPVAFGGDHGPQLAAVAAAAGVPEAQVVEDVTGADLRVLALGFAPGQPYLGFLPQAYDLPRQGDLTARVPAASIVLAVRQIVLFANAAPTGWRLIGQTRFPCFRPEAEVPVALRAGDVVRFHRTGHDEFEALAETPMGGARSEPAS